MKIKKLINSSKDLTSLFLTKLIYLFEPSPGSRHYNNNCYPTHFLVLNTHELYTGHGFFLGHKWTVKCPSAKHFWHKWTLKCPSVKRFWHKWTVNSSYFN